MDRNLGKAVPTHIDSARAIRPRLNLSTLHAGTFRTHFANRFEDAVNTWNLCLVYLK